jgi:tetratricopeptide (TPR) repeat protein
MRIAAVLAFAAVALVAGSGARAGEYWSYNYGQLAVVTAGDPADAKLLAQRLTALDGALRKLLRRPNGASSPPTAVYILPGAELAALDPIWNAEGGTYFRAAPFDDYLVLPSEHGASVSATLTAERTMGLLASWGLARLPDWYRQGVAQLAAGAVYGADRITIGQDVAEQASRLAHDWIPMEKILRLPSTDPDFNRSPESLALYQAQCWWLVHLLLIDGVLDPALSRYVDWLMAGRTPDAAFAESFGAGAGASVSYEQVDEYFRSVKRGAKLRTYSTSMPDAGAAAPVPLTEEAYKASVAQLAVSHDAHSARGQQLVAEVLAAEADNARALLVQAQSQLAARKFAEADAIVLRVRAQENLAASERRVVGMVEAALAGQKDEALPGTEGLDARKIRSAARADLRRALELDPADPRALYELGWLLAGQGDVAAVRELLPAMEAEYYQRSDSVELAALLVRMNSIAGDMADVFKYSVAEQHLAATETERARAAARVERLRPLYRSSQ